MGSEFVNTRDLKNRTTELLRKAEGGKVLIITRRGKPVATLKMYSPQDVIGAGSTSIYEQIKENIAEKYPALKKMSTKELRDEFESTSKKVRGFDSWEEMDRALKGDPYGLSR
ncbi:MAG: type II toxin-antitoxin system prevent-host-death family antitoxin [Clostridia bacterium]|nr:type II toxin-antitoxin system prevent-host-death family antitoxin [Clostridia bacterium]